MLDTPICDFVLKYDNEENIRLHMPGHKGNKLLGCENMDITEIDGADVLYNANGIIKQSEQNASKIFGTAKTLYSTAGSSLVIMAMVYLASQHAKENGIPFLIVAGRNAHKAFISAAALTGAEVQWLYPKDKTELISCTITANDLEEMFNTATSRPAAVYLTSPDYLGNVLDIAKLSAVCKKHNCLLLVDNAHGAYLNFLKEPQHPIKLGADMCADSAHKTLPVLTGGAYLHISKKAPKQFCEQAESAMSIFASTSPSYLILQSLDKANSYLNSNYKEKLQTFVPKLTAIKKVLQKNGYNIIGNEPLKLTIATKMYGYTGVQIADILKSNKIIPEFYDEDFVVMMFSAETTDTVLEFVKNTLIQIKRRKAINSVAPQIVALKRAMSLREAVFSKSKKIKASESSGKILSQTAVNCPPAVSIIVSGEIIDDNVVEAFRYYGIDECFVVDKI